jgi:hypothetical protein
LASDPVLTLLLLALALTVLAGALLPQIPSELDQPDATARWIAETGSRFGGMGELLGRAGFFSLWQGLWIRVLLGLLAFVLLLRLGLALGEVLSWFGDPDPIQTGLDARSWPLQATAQLNGQVDSILAEVTEDLDREGWRIARTSSAGEAHVLAQRHPVGLGATPLLYGGLLLALAGLWLGQVLGWRTPGIALIPNEPVRVAQAGRLTLILEDDGSNPTSLVAQRDGVEEARHPFSLGENARLRGLTVRSTSEGLALAVLAQDAAGNPLQLQPLEETSSGQEGLNLVFDQPRAERVFLVPERQLAFSVVAFPSLPERGFTGPTFLVQAFRVGQQEPIYNEFLPGAGDIRMDGDLYQIQSGRFVTVQVSHDPGLPLVVAGLLLAVAGGLLGLVRPAGRLYLGLRIERDEVHMQASLLPSPAWRQARRWFTAWTATYGGETQS